MPARTSLFLILATLAVATPASAQQQHKPAKPAPARPARTAGPTAMGRFEDWTAATNKEAGQTVCYAFTRASGATVALPGRGDVVLTVTERPGGRDSVAISVGFAYPANAVATVTADASTFDFYTAGRSAFARDGHAVALAFQRARQVQARSPAPKGKTVTDSFSLRGFSAAYAAIQKACPPGKAPP